MRAKKGDPAKWLLAHVEYQGEGCLTWPFGLDKHGRGRVTHDGERCRAHRLMCRLKHGEPPSPAHEAAHSCGKGHEACVHPLHLSWKTHTENMADCKVHGTQPENHNGPRGPLTPENVQTIRCLLGTKSQLAISKIFGVHETVINQIGRGRTYARPSKVNFWSSDDEERLKYALELGANVAEVAKALGRTRNATDLKARRMGLIGQEE